MRMFSQVLLLSLLLVLPISSWADVIHVPGDYAQINQAVAAASAGDSIAVGPGTYAEGVTIVITIPLTLYSTNGAEATILDGGNARRILWCFESAGAVVQGFTFVNGAGFLVTPAGGAMLVSRGARATIEDCVFRNCSGYEGAGAIYVSDSGMNLGTSLTARRCLFEQNSAPLTGGAVYVVLGATATFSDCTFRRNQTETYAGAVHAHVARMDFERCLFDGNIGGVAGALYYGTEGSGYVRNSTFANNESPSHGTIVAGAGSDISGNVIAGDPFGFGVQWLTGAGTHSCNVFWNNADGAMSGATLAATETVADPLFCDPALGDFHVNSGSPCLPGNSVGCGLIGAFGQGCGGAGIEAMVWLQRKQINLGPKKRWVIAYIQPDPSYAASDIDIASIRLFGNIPESPGVPVDLAAMTRIADNNRDGVLDLLVGFPYADVSAVLTPGDAVPISITGLVAGTLFRGETTVQVVDPSGGNLMLTFSDGKSNVGAEPAQVTFSLGEGPGIIEVFDVMGRRVLERRLDDLGQGSQVVEIRERIASGVYVARFSQEGQMQTKRALILH